MYPSADWKRWNLITTTRNRACSGDIDRFIQRKRSRTNLIRVTSVVTDHRTVSLCTQSRRTSAYQGLMLAVVQPHGVHREPLEPYRLRRSSHEKLTLSAISQH